MVSLRVSAPSQPVLFLCFQYGNVLDVPNPTASPTFSLTPSATSPAVVTSTIYNGALDTWTFRYTANDAAVTYTFNAAICTGLPNPTINMSPFTLVVQPNTVAVANSFLAIDVASTPWPGTPPSFVAGDITTIYVQAQDAFNNKRQSANTPTAHFTVEVTTPRPSTAIVTCNSGNVANAPHITNLGCNYDAAGRYVITFVATRSGTHSVAVKLSGTIIGAGATAKNFVVTPGTIACHSGSVPC